MTGGPQSKCHTHFPGASLKRGMPGVETTNPGDEVLTAPPRYEGLDAFRPVAAFGVIVLHLGFMRDAGMSLTWLMRLRDCALPFLVMCSFFLMARSVWRKPESEFRRFASLRFKYIGLPFFVWTFIYCAVWDVVRPLTKGAGVSWPDLTLLVSGYVHLWYLQVLLLGSLALYPLLRLAARAGRRQVALVFIAGALCHALWLAPALDARINAYWLEQNHSRLHTLIAGANTCLLYILLAVVVALYADKIAGAYRYRSARLLSLAFVAAAMLLHCSAYTNFGTRIVYSVSLFVTLLQPVPAFLARALRPLGKYSYPIYILHFGISYVVSGAFSRAHVATSAVSLLAGSAAIFCASVLCAIFIRALFRCEWLLPLVPLTAVRPAVKPRHSLGAIPEPASAAP